MRRWGERSSTPALFDIWRIRAIGEWGHASRHVGQRWEEVGLDLLRKEIVGDGLAGFLPVCADPELQTELAATGSKNPDVILVATEGDELILRSADLKWSLDVASYLQISGNVLRELLTQVPRLSETLRALLPSESTERAWAVRDGYFFAPASVANQRFLTTAENKKQEYPIEESEVRFAPVDAYAFFEPLPGWATARELARLDGAARGLPLLDNADRYYHLGAGVAGALASADQSIFDDEALIDPDREVERLRTFLKTLSPPTTGAVIDRLNSLMRHRQELSRELRNLVRTAYSFHDFVEEVIQRGLASKSEPEAAIRRQFGEVFRTLTEEQDQENRRAGRRLRAKGLTDAQALEHLSAESDAATRRLRLRARALLMASNTDGN